MFRQRALGAILGSAIGDALGAPFEFGPSKQYSRRFPQPVFGGTGELIGGGGFNWAPGEFTDDTQMAIVQAESVLAHSGVDRADLFHRFQSWAGGAKDVGNQTRAVLGSSRGWETAALDYYRRNPNSSAGNGSLMRATPTAVHFALGEEEETIAAAHECSSVTHADPAAGWGTALYHAMIRAALRGADPFEALESRLAALPADQARYREMLAASWEPSQASLPNGTVWTCLAQAVWAVRTHRDSFNDAVTAAIDLGGDTDTLAAVTGGLGGALHGVQNIPSRWMTYVHGSVTTADGRRTFRASDLQALTLRLLNDAPMPETPCGPPEGPTEIAPGIFAADLGAASGVPRDWAVLSLCRVGERFANHPVRREMFLIDRSAEHNPALAVVIDDAVRTIDAWRAEGRTIVVHCHGGGSRTGLVLRAWLMRQGHSADEATALVKERWPAFGEWNESFTSFLSQGW